MSRHVVVTGAGTAGLAAAIDLARAGLDVTVCERHASPGGKMREILIGDAAVDSGPTVFTMRWVFEELFESAGADIHQHLSLERADVLARHFWLDGSRLDLHADVHRSADAIRTFAGDRDAEAYLRFAEESADIFRTLDHSFMRRDKPGPLGLTLSLGARGLPRLIATRPFTTLWKALSQRFSDPRLRQLFARYATYCGSSPFEAPATLMLIAHAEQAGVWAVAGGMQRLADALAGLARRLGANVVFGRHVEQVIPTKQHGFRVTTAGGDEYGADAVIYTGDVAALEAGLLGSAVRRALPTRDSETRSLSALTWSACADAGDFPLAHHSVFFGGDYRDEFECIFARRRITDEPTVYVCAQDRGGSPDRTPGGKERLFLLINAPPASLSDDEIERAERAAFELLARAGFCFRPDSGELRRQGPDDYAALFPGSDGAIYGWPTHGPFGSFRRAGAATSIPGLYCAGGTVHPGPGVPMATLSGRIAASRVLDYLNR